MVSVNLLHEIKLQIFEPNVMPCECVVSDAEGTFGQLVLRGFSSPGKRWEKAQDEEVWM